MLQPSPSNIDLPVAILSGLRKAEKHGNTATSGGPPPSFVHPISVPAALRQKRCCGSITPATSPRTPAPAPRSPSPQTPPGPRTGTPSPNTTRASCPRPVSPRPPPAPRSAPPESPSPRTGPPSPQSAPPRSARIVSSTGTQVAPRPPQRERGQG